MSHPLWVIPFSLRPASPAAHPKPGEAVTGIDDHT